MAKIALFLVLVYICLQLAFTSPRVARDAEEPKDPEISKEVEDALKVLRCNFDQLVKTIQDNDMFKDLSARIQTFSAEIAAQGKQIAEKLQIGNVED